MKNTFVISSLSFVVVFAFWAAFPQNASAEGWICSAATYCYASAGDCYARCADPSLGAGRSCTASVTCVPGSGEPPPTTPPPTPAAGWQCQGSGTCYDSIGNCFLGGASRGCSVGTPTSCVQTSCTPGTTPPPDSPVTPPSPSRPLSLPNPLGEGASTIPQLLERIAKFLVLLAAPLVAIMVLFGAYQMLFAAGDPEKFGTGKKTILYVVIGYAIILIAWGVTGIIESVLRGDSVSPPSATSTTPGGIGTSCTTAFNCSSGLFCNYSNSLAGQPGVCSATGTGGSGGVGTSCAGDANCTPGLFCNLSAGVPGRCSTIPIGGSGGLGSPCTSGADCTFPLLCNYSAGSGSALVCSNP